MALQRLTKSVRLIEDQLDCFLGLVQRITVTADRPLHLRPVHRLDRESPVARFRSSSITAELRPASDVSY